MKKKRIYIPVQESEGVDTNNAMNNNGEKLIYSQSDLSRFFGHTGFSHWLKPVEQYTFTKEELEQFITTVYDEGFQTGVTDISSDIQKLGESLREEYINSLSIE